MESWKRGFCISVNFIHRNVMNRCTRTLFDLFAQILAHLWHLGPLRWSHRDPDFFLYQNVHFEQSRPNRSGTTTKKPGRKTLKMRIFCLFPFAFGRFAFCFLRIASILLISIKITLIFPLNLFDKHRSTHLRLNSSQKKSQCIASNTIILACT